MRSESEMNITRMAREAGANRSSNPDEYDIWKMQDQKLERFAALVAAAERAECAKVCADKARTVTNEANAKTAINHCAANIRARGEEWNS